VFERQMVNKVLTLIELDEAPDRAEAHAAAAFQLDKFFLLFIIPVDFSQCVTRKEVGDE